MTDPKLYVPHDWKVTSGESVYIEWTRGRDRKEMRGVFVKCASCGRKGFIRTDRRSRVVYLIPRAEDMELQT